MSKLYVRISINELPVDAEAVVVDEMMQSPPSKLHESVLHGGSQKPSDNQLDGQPCEQSGTGHVKYIL